MPASLLKPLFIGAASFALLACSGEMDHSKMSHNQEAAQSLNRVEVSSAVINPPFSGRTTAAGFFTLENKGPDARLIAAASPISKRVEIHTHLNEDGVMKMRRIDGVDIAAGETLEFKPGGYHLMMFDTVLDDTAAEAPLTLRYADGHEVTLIVPIDGRSEMAAPKKDKSKSYGSSREGH